MQFADIDSEQLKTELQQQSIGKDIDYIEKALQFIHQVHAHEMYATGKPIINHLLNTAHILVQLNLDWETVCAGLLHDSLDDINTREERKIRIRAEFGNEVANIVENIAKSDEVIKKNQEKVSSKVLSKVVLGTAKDIRVLFIGLASTLEKLQSFDSSKTSEQKNVSQLVIEFHVPLAHKLGLYEIEWELRDLAFKILEPIAYQNIKKEVGEKRKEREKVLTEFSDELHNLLEKTNIGHTLQVRPKSFYGIYKKTKNKNVNVKELDDLLGARILCNNIEDCYKSVGVLHSNYEHTNHFDDYITKPKPNGYQSIHTVIQRNGKLIEVQIRTWDMHRTAEEGVAAHWEYKHMEKDPWFDKPLAWAKQMIEWQQKVKAKELMHSLHIEFGGKEIFVLTPKNEVIVLTAGATALDFAFAIHTELGYACEKIIVNEKIVPFDHPLENGDVVKVIKGGKEKVKRQWLALVKTSKAKEKIRQKLGLHLDAKTSKKAKTGKSTSDKNMELAHCCNPLPGEEIIGIKTTKRKIHIHRLDCANTKKIPEARWIDLHWHTGAKNYDARIQVMCQERTTLLLDLLEIFAKNGILVKSAEAKPNRNKTMTCAFTLQVTSAEDFENLTEKIRKVSGVFRIERK